MMQYKQDVEAIFYFDDNKKQNIYEGYRPAHMVQEGYLTTGVHSYYNVGGDTDEMKGTIKFISPEYYPNSLWIGKKIEMYEGSKIIGYAIITKIFNSILEINSE